MESPGLPGCSMRMTCYAATRVSKMDLSLMEGTGLSGSSRL
jgi:hypothetical protein